MKSMRRIVQCGLEPVRPLLALATFHNERCIFRMRSVIHTETWWMHLAFNSSEEIVLPFTVIVWDTPSTTKWLLDRPEEWQLWTVDSVRLSSGPLRWGDQLRDFLVLAWDPVVERGPPMNQSNYTFWCVLFKMEMFKKLRNGRKSME